ncbi:MAG: hypothetical protein E6Q90_07955 [Actinobacteria bacterium]|nr:MAG: hypothetical protein E6Q90_07955 [Actinomycetota bacterium]
MRPCEANAPTVEKTPHQESSGIREHQGTSHVVVDESITAIDIGGVLLRALLLLVLLPVWSVGLFTGPISARRRVLLDHMTQTRPHTGAAGGHPAIR